MKRYNGTLMECPDQRLHIEHFPLALRSLIHIELEGSPKGGSRSWAMFPEASDMSLMGYGDTPPKALEALARFWQEEIEFHLKYASEIHE